MEELAKKLKSKFTYKENYAMYFHDEEGKVRPYSLGEVIERCYSKYREAYSKKINREIDALRDKKLQLECLTDMSEHAVDIVTDNKLSDEDKIHAIIKATDYQYDERVIRECLNKPIRYFKRDDKAVEETENQIKKKLHDLQYLDDLIVSEVTNYGK